ncbi:MAG: glycosyl hydrolase family 79 C-terminal domain-containing protein, partial [Solirubrobacteraceae bacterium]
MPLPPRKLGLAAAFAGLAIACALPIPTADAFVSSLTVTSTQHGRPRARGWLGLALEYRSIPVLAGGTTAAGVDPVLVALVRSLDPDGGTVLRIGGQSGDRSWWPVPGMRRPLGITYDLTPSWVASAGALTQALGAHLILGVGLEANRPRIDALESRRLIDGLGARQIEALELGNEPLLYSQVPWYRLRHGAPVPWYSRVGAPVYARGQGYGIKDYLRDWSRALAVLPPVPIAGPDGGDVSLLDGFDALLSPRSRVRVVTWHEYALSQCDTDPASTGYPSVPDLLTLVASRTVLGDVGPTIALAHRDGARFRVDEMGSISCNGRAGVSDTLASALWLLDALFYDFDAGVDGVNLHTYTNSVNDLFEFARRGGRWQATVAPLYYGALMFAQAAPPGSRLLAIRAPGQGRLRAWATLAPDHRVRVLLIDDSLTRSALALVRVPGHAGAGTVERLRAGSAYATTGVTLGGKSFGTVTTTGLLAAPAAQTVRSRGAGATYAVTLPARSAALLTLD